MTKQSDTDGPATLSTAEQDCLRCIVGHMIPASERYGVPGADDPVIFADMLASVSNTQLSSFENGHALPTLITLAELAQIYQVDAADLIVHAACHSKPDKQVLALRVAEPTFRAVLTHKFAERRFRELARKKPLGSKATGSR